VHRYLHPLLELIQSGRLDATFIVSHRWPLSRAPEAYHMFNDKRDECTKVVLDPTG
jgi:threonine dehydrogenase-like Zn-dependent dehydrogenase